jgi:hypothetical protein
MKSSLSVTMLSLLLLSLGCAGRQPQPIMISSAGATGYALDYPQRLSAETNMLVADRQKASELSQGLGTRANELKAGADPGLVLLIVQQADEVGHSEGFAVANDEGRGLHSFWDEERGPITARVNGAAQKQLTEAKCTQADVSGAIGYALKDGVDKQLEKWLRAHNEAQRTIERHKGSLGSANVSAVQKLADDIALASYLVNIALVLERNRISRLLSERSDIESTLSNEIDWERAFQAESHSAVDKKASQERMAALQKSRAAVPAAATSAEAARKDLDLQINDARKRYQSGLEALENELRAQQARAKR